MDAGLPPPELSSPPHDKPAIAITSTPSDFFMSPISLVNSGYADSSRRPIVRSALYVRQRTSARGGRPSNLRGPVWLRQARQAARAHGGVAEAVERDAHGAGDGDQQLGVGLVLAALTLAGEVEVAAPAQAGLRAADQGEGDAAVVVQVAVVDVRAEVDDGVVQQVALPERGHLHPLR